MNWFKWVMFSLQLATAIPTFIKAAEDAIGSGNGEQKKNLAVGSVGVATKLAGGSDVQTQATMGIASAAIDATVGILNSVNALKNN